MGSSASTPGADNGNDTKDKNNNKSGKAKRAQIRHQGKGPYQPYSEFPDIQRMRQAQLEFGESTYKIQNDDNGTPLPFPTLKSRQQIFEEYDFSTIDSHAEKAAPGLSHDSGRLVSYLCEGTKDDVEKIRAIFAWISSRNRRNTLIELEKGSLKNDSPLNYLLDIMVSANTYQYNSLFALLCREADIPYKMITGHIRAAIKELGDAPTSRGTYFMVFVGDNWRFVHPHWGSCYVRSIRSETDWELVEGVSGAKQGLSSTGRADILAFNREDFWFFVDPEVMAHFFLSEQAENQLLARAITQEEFRQMARLYQPFFLRGFKSISPAKCRLEAEESVIIEIGLPDDDNMNYNYGIFKRAIDPDWKHSTDFRRLVFMERVGDKLRIRLDMPHIGVYKFEVSKQDSPSSSASYTLCEYLIDNKKPNFSCRPHPKNDLNEWGIGPKSKQLGLEPEKEGGLIETQSGQTVIGFKQKETENSVHFRYKLEDEKGDSDKLENYIRLAKYADKSSVFIKTPHHGKYVLKVEGKSSKEKELKTLSNFLVVSDRGVSDDSPFPKAHNGEIGLLDNSNPPLLVPVSHTEAVIDGIKEGQLQITMKERDDLDIKPSLIIDEQNNSQYVYHYKINDQWVFILHLPSAGSFSFLIEGRENGSDKAYRPIYSYVIVSERPKPNCRPFPQIMSDWRNNFRIIEPLEGLLFRETRQRFRFYIPGSEKLLLIRGQEEISLEKRNSSSPDKRDKNSNNDDIWEKELDTGKTAAVISLVVQLKGSENTLELLKYRVMSKQEEEALQNALKQAGLEADERKKKIQKKDAEEEREAEKRKKAMEKKIREAEEDFKRNKDKYLEKQRKLEEEAKKKESQLFEMKEFNARKQQKEEDKWKDLQHKITNEMHYERLREAIKLKNAERLQTAIDQAVMNGISEDDELLMRARTEIEVANLKEALRLAVEKKDPSEVNEVITKISQNNYYLSRLQQDVADALKMLDRLMKINNMKLDHLKMNSALFAELRRYNKPPDVVHKVVQAALLLFEKDEETTENWRTCQQHLVPSGPKSMHRKILDFDPSSVHPEVAARSREILKQYELDKVQDVSPAASTIYVWALGATDPLVPKGSNIVPASVERQCELFGYPQKSPKKNYDFRIK